MRKGSTQSKDQFGELKKRLLFLLFGLVIFRVGAHIPVAGVDVVKLNALFTHSNNGFLNLFNMFSGGSLARFTVFALGVMPYISASIIMQLLTSMVPKLEQLKKEGDAGRRKINQYIRFATLGLACFQSLGITKWLAFSGFVYDPDFSFFMVAMFTLITGSMFLMWLGEQITEKGIGNGISLIIFCGIVARLPQAVSSLLNQVHQGQMQLLAFFGLVAVVVLVVLFVVYVERAQRRITIYYARRQAGMKAYGAGASSHLPLKINMAGVIPPIFASAMIVFPSTLATWVSQAHGWAWLAEISAQLSPGQPLYLIFFIGAILFFCFFYTAIIFNPKDTADELKRGGALLQGIRPGQQTANYIDLVMSRLTLIGAIYLIIVALMPDFLVLAWHVPFSFGGTSLLIVVVVVMDFIVQVQTHMMSQKYEGLIRKRKKR